MPPGRPGPGPVLSHTDLSSPPRLGCGPHSSSRLTGRRSPRPPPPPATASFPFAAATAGAHAGPALPSPETETGKGGAGAAENPALVASRRSAVACPHRGATEPAWPGLGARWSEHSPEEEPREAPPPAAVSAGSAEVKRKSARRRMAGARAGGKLRGGGVREQEKGGVSRFRRRGVRLFRLLQSPRAQRHHLGKNADLAAAAQAGRTAWAGRVSRQAARATRPGEGSRSGRTDAGRGRCARGTAPRSAPPPTAASAPLQLAVVGSAGAVGKGK